MLEEQRAEIEAELDAKLIWHNPPDTMSAKVYLVREVDVKDESRWQEYCEWLKTKLEALRQVFIPRVKALPPVSELVGTSLT